MSTAPLTRQLTSLGEASLWLSNWLETALNLWSDAGFDPIAGVFEEALSPQAVPIESPLRSRVQCRQIYVFATSAINGAARVREIAVVAHSQLLRRYLNIDGLVIKSVDRTGLPIDTTAHLYEQAFALLAMAAVHKLDPQTRSAVFSARRIKTNLTRFRHPIGGYREVGPHPFQSNAHMHLLEASLAWEHLDPEGFWGEMSDDIVALVLSSFTGPAKLFVREFFDDNWQPAAGSDGQVVEPGHQFEWAWLLTKWSQRRANVEVDDLAAQLYRAGLNGFDDSRGVVVNTLNADFEVTDSVARLWPQTEFLKAAIARNDYVRAIHAANGLADYLRSPQRGLWHEYMEPDGQFRIGPSPATSFYHLHMAIFELLASQPASNVVPLIR